MAINNLAPGVYSTLQDLSTFVDTLPSTTGFIPIICESGPDNQLIRVTPSTFGKNFGNPNLNYTNSRDVGLGPYVAKNFLSESSNLYVIRCLPESATYANILIETDDFLVDSNDLGVVPSDQTCGITVSTILNMNNQNELLGQLSTGVGDTSSNVGGYNLLIMRGLGRGEFYNNLMVDINPHPNASVTNFNFREGIYIIDIYQLQKYTNRVVTQDTTTGTDYADYSLVETFEVSFDPEAKDENTDSQFIQDVINNYSNLIRVECSKSILKEIARRQKLASGQTLTMDFSTGFINSHNGVDDAFELSYGISLENGSSGPLFNKYGIVIDSTSSSETATDILAAAYAGTLPSAIDGTSSPLVEVFDTENFQFDIVFDAGYPIDVKTKIVELTSTRRDCLAIIDNGDHYSASVAETKRVSGDTLAYNTPYAALYEPYTKVYDVYTGSDIFMPPSFHMAKIVGYNDKNSELWYPLAGFNRAVIQNIKEMRYNPSLADRENFIKYNLNPIVRFTTGYSVFSQRTTYRTASALQEIHIIRLQMFIDRSLKQFCKNFIFELNDETTRSKVRAEITTFLAEIKSKRALESFSVSTPATEYDIKRRRISVNITLKPTRSVEQIFLNYFIV
jgi:hypothetical protein